MCGQKRFKYKLWGPDFDYYVAECSPMDIQMVQLGDDEKKKKKKRKKSSIREHRRSEIHRLKSHRLNVEEDDDDFDDSQDDFPEELPPACQSHLNKCLHCFVHRLFVLLPRRLRGGGRYQLQSRR